MGLARIVGIISLGLALGFGGCPSPSENPSRKNYDCNLTQATEKNTNRTVWKTKFRVQPVKYENKIDEAISAYNEQNKDKIKVEIDEVNEGKLYSFNVTFYNPRLCDLAGTTEILNLSVP